MIKKRKLMILLIIFILIVITIFGFVIINKTTKKDKNLNLSLSNEIVNRMKNNEKMIIYIEDDFEGCYLCSDTNKIIKYYEEVYDVKFIHFNKSKTGEKDFLNLIDKLGYEKDFIKTPALITIKDGYSTASINELVFENDIKDFLIKYDYLDKKYQDNDIGLNTTNKFNEIYKSNTRSLIVLYTYENDGYTLRKKIFNFSKKYNFKYYNIYYGVGDSLIPYNTIVNDIGKNISIPSIIVVQNNRVVDYITSNNNVKIKEFLNKNGFIK